MGSDLETDLRKAFEPAAERLAGDYRRMIEQAYREAEKVAPEDRVRARMGRPHPTLGALEWQRILDATRRCRRYVRLDGGQMSGNASLSAEFLDKEAREYGESQATAFVDKLIRKLDGARDARVLYDDHAATSFVIKAWSGDDEIRVDQQKVLQWSTRGTPFHQFPARLYLNGTPTTEKDLRSLLDERLAAAREKPAPGAAAEPDEEADPSP